MYVVMAEPPVFAGGVQLTVAVTGAPTAPWVAVPMFGSAGTVVAGGVTVLDDAEAGPAPALLIAVTTKCTATPLASGVTMPVALGEADRRPPTGSPVLSSTWIR